MKHKLLLFLLMLVVLMASAAIAKEAPIATLVDPADIPVRTAMPVNAAQVGNLNDPAWLLSGWFIGDEEYKYLFNPVEQLNCPLGFQLTTVHMLLEFPIVPVTFEVWVDLEDASWRDDIQCWWPGVEDCRSDVFTVTIDVAGVYDIAIPINCDCAYMIDPLGLPYWYLLSMHFIGQFNANVITDGIQSRCTNFNDWGTGWEDLDPYFATYGTINMWGDVICCDDPVAVEEKSWGGIKSLFR